MWYLLGDPRWTTYLLFFQFIISIHDGWNVISFLPRLFYFNFNFFSWTTNPIKITDRIQFQFTQWQDNTRDLQSITCGTSNITDHTHFIHSFSIHALIINFMHIIICLYTTIAMPWNIVHLTLFGKKSLIRRRRQIGLQIDLEYITLFRSHNIVLWDWQYYVEYSPHSISSLLSWWGLGCIHLWGKPIEGEHIFSIILDTRVAIP